MFPGSRVSRLKRERKKEWDKQQRERMAGLQGKLADFDEANSTPKGDKKKERV